MANLCDIIEEFIKRSFKEAEDIIEIQRNEMANMFQCAPSQINYVLTTRFTLEKGYFIESRRGGGGYIRIKKLRIMEDEILQDIIEYIGDSISSSEARDIIERLLDEDIITERESYILTAIVNRHSIPVDASIRDEVRAKLLKASITAIMDHKARKGGHIS